MYSIVVLTVKVAGCFLNFKAKPFRLEAGGKPIVVLNQDDVEDLGVRSLGRVRVRYGGKELIAIVNTTQMVLQRGEIGLYEEVRGFLKSPEGAIVDVEASLFPLSTTYIRKRLMGRSLSSREIKEIVEDTVKGNLSEVEIASFVLALQNHPIDADEAFSLSCAMVETGESLVLDRKIVADKHSIGGVPGDKTTLLVVPIIAACGITIPKCSSRAITSAAGSADKAEALMNVVFGMEEIKKVVNKTNGCIVWGGSLNMAPADDIFIKVEYPLSIDPLLLPSIMSKKKAVGANRLVIDLPTGRGTKIKTLGDANMVANDFILLGSRLGIKTQCAITYGEQPVGHAIGSALEAREALEVLSGEKNIVDLIDKATDIAGILLELCGVTNGKHVALDTLRSGKAEKKMREIIGEQGGDPNIRPDEIPLGTQKFELKSNLEGIVLWIDNQKLVDTARISGSPRDLGAGLHLHKKLGDKVKKNETLITVYSKNAIKIQRAQKKLEEEPMVAVGKKMEMLLAEVKVEPVHEKTFILER